MKKIPKNKDNSRNIILGVLSIVCLTIIILFLFRSGKPREIEYTGPEIAPGEEMKEAQLLEEELEVLQSSALTETARQSALDNQLATEPRVASPRVAELQSEAVRESRQRSLDARKGDIDIDPETEAKMEEVRKMRERQAKERNR